MKVFWGLGNVCGFWCHFCYIGAGAYLIRGMEELGGPLINFLLLGIAGEVWGLCVLCQIFHFAE